MVMVEVSRSGVNPWDCDVMGHLNVRHYFARANEGLALLLLELGFGPQRLRQQRLVLRAIDQHVRFQRELRPGNSYCVRAGVVKVTGDVLHAYEEVVVRPEQKLSATILTEAVLIDRETRERQRFPDQLQRLSHPIHSEIPPHGAAKGIDREPPRPPVTRSAAIERGLLGGYLGPILPEDCDAAGIAREAGLMARVSDGIGHFFRALRAPAAAKGVGSAALEYRYVFRTWPRVGDFVEVRSGVRAVGAKTTNVCHFIFDVETGECLASAEAVTVSFDLTTRKSIELPGDVRAALQQHVIPGLSI